MSVLMLNDKGETEDLDFIAEMIASLNGILFTAPELFVLRERLRNRNVSVNFRSRFPNATYCYLITYVSLV
jgi:hypothetical protein